MRVLRPHQRPVRSRRGQDDTVGKRQFPVTADLRGAERKVTIQRHDLALVHDRGNLKRGILATLRQHPLAHLEDADGGDNERARVLDGGGVHIRVRAVGKVFDRSHAPAWERRCDAPASQR